MLHTHLQMTAQFTISSSIMSALQEMSYHNDGVEESTSSHLVLKTMSYSSSSPKLDIEPESFTSTSVTYANQSIM